MINKKILLGKIPQELGIKDAVHVAIVSVRASCAIQPGTKCIINKDREAEPCCNGKHVGIADPFLKKVIMKGQNFLLFLNPDEVDNVQHTWEHKVDFTPPTTKIKYDITLVNLAKEYGVTYEQLIEGMNYVVNSDQKEYGNYRSAPYPGNKTKEELEELEDMESDKWSIWSAYSDETLYEFENIGSACCPEYQYPECSIFDTNARA